MRRLFIAFLLSFNFCHIVLSSQTTHDQTIIELQQKHETQRAATFSIWKELCEATQDLKQLPQQAEQERQRLLRAMLTTRAAIYQETQALTPEKSDSKRLRKLYNELSALEQLTYDTASACSNQQATAYEHQRQLGLSYRIAQKKLSATTAHLQDALYEQARQQHYQEFERKSSSSRPQRSILGDRIKGIKLERDATESMVNES